MLGVGDLTTQVKAPGTGLMLEPEFDRVPISPVERGAAGTPLTAHPGSGDGLLHAVANQLRRDSRQHFAMGGAVRIPVLDDAGKNQQQFTPLVAAYPFRQQTQTGYVTKLDCSENLLPRYVAHFFPPCAGGNPPTVTRTSALEQMKVALVPAAAGGE